MNEFFREGEAVTPEKDWKVRTRHGMNCPGSRGEWEDCTCGLQWRDKLDKAEAALKEAMARLDWMNGRCLRIDRVRESECSGDYMEINDYCSVIGRGKTVSQAIDSVRAKSKQ